jgi:hypothetical protein
MSDEQSDYLKKFAEERSDSTALNPYEGADEHIKKQRNVRGQQHVGPGVNSNSPPTR